MLPVPATEDAKGKKLKGKKVALAPVFGKKEAKKVVIPLCWQRKRPPVLRTGVNTVITLVETKKAQLVVIAQAVDPIELVVCLLALCRRMGIPYCIIKGKTKLGCLAHRKTCTTVAFAQVTSEEKGALAKQVEAIRTNYDDRCDEICRHWRGNVLGPIQVRGLYCQFTDRPQDGTRKISWSHFLTSDCSVHVFERQHDHQTPELEIPMVSGGKIQQLMHEDSQPGKFSVYPIRWIEAKEERHGPHIAQEEQSRDCEIPKDGGQLHKNSGLLPCPLASSSKADGISESCFCMDENLRENVRGVTQG
ncbi:hypothetical protein GH733_006147, partial [Mirounga leonina]